jgi:lysyl-tRNA synthetase class 2
MVKHGFTELTMPTMEETTGGAEATPFITHHQALDEDFYLRISSELHQKRMIVGGFEKIFDIDKNFRNEGIDDEHLQEFTQMEFYWAYASYEDLLDYGEKLIKYVIQETFGTLELDYNGKKVDWSRTWPRLTYYEFVEKYAGIRLTEYDTLEKLQDLATELGLTFDQTDGYGRLMDLIYKKTARPKCIDPVWLIDQPVEISPLAKRKPDNPKLTQRLQLIAYGSELCNGYSELNDPIDQLARFEEQQRLRESGDDEAMMLDRDFVTALEIGMPPTAGFGYSERLFSVLARKPIRETVPFPLMKRKVGDGGKAKKTMVAHAIILDKPEISIWTKFNTVAHLAASLGAREGKKLMHIDHSRTTDGEKIPMPIQHAILVKKTDQPEKLLDLKRMAEQKGLRVTCFTEEMEVNIGHEEVHHVQENKSKDQIGWLGVMIFGKKSDVEELTDDLELFS